jgi:uncharacterized protein YndB with AHSA1/START domain
MSDRSAVHATFVIERDYPASAAQVFAAWADLDAKNQWFGPDGGGDAHTLEFREGGREHFEAEVGGSVYHYDALYEDIVKDERIVYTYNMHRGAKRMSVSVSTVELVPAAAGTQLRYTEQGVFLDGTDTPDAREHGTRELLDKLAGALAQGAVAR